MNNPLQLGSPVDRSDNVYLLPHTEYEWSLSQLQAVPVGMEVFDAIKPVLQQFISVIFTVLKYLILHVFF